MAKVRISKKGLWQKIEQAYKFAPISLSIRFCITVAILIVAWDGFTRLAGLKNVDDIPALIMTWLSVGLILIAIYPRILDRIESFKFKDFELKFKASIQEASLKDFINPDPYVMFEKADFNQLRTLLQRAAENTELPVLLTVNVYDPQYISISMLFTYLLLLEIFGHSTIVLFIEQARTRRRQTPIEKDAVIGATSGKNTLKTFYSIFPHLRQVVETLPSEPRFRDALGDERIPSLDFIRALNRTADEHIEQRYLSRENILSWFENLLDDEIIDNSLTKEDIRIVRNALRSRNEFVLLFDKQRFVSIIILCRLARNLSQSVLSEQKVSD